MCLLDTGGGYSPDPGPASVNLGQRPEHLYHFRMSLADRNRTAGISFSPHWSHDNLPYFLLTADRGVRNEYRQAEMQNERQAMSYADHEIRL